MYPQYFCNSKLDKATLDKRKTATSASIDEVYRSQSPINFKIDEYQTGDLTGFNEN